MRSRALSKLFLCLKEKKKAPQFGLKRVSFYVPFPFSNSYSQSKERDSAVPLPLLTPGAQSLSAFPFVKATGPDRAPFVRTTFSVSLELSAYHPRDRIRQLYNGINLAGSPGRTRCAGDSIISRVFQARHRSASRRGYSRARALYNARL